MLLSLVSYSCSIGSEGRGRAEGILLSYKMSICGSVWVFHGSRMPRSPLGSFIMGKYVRPERGQMGSLWGPTIAHLWREGLLYGREKIQERLPEWLLLGFREGRSQAAGDTWTVSRKGLHSALGLRRELDGAPKGRWF